MRTNPKITAGSKNWDLARKCRPKDNQERRQLRRRSAQERVGEPQTNMPQTRTLCGGYILAQSNRLQSCATGVRLAGEIKVHVFSKPTINGEGDVKKTAII